MAGGINVKIKGQNGIIADVVIPDSFSSVKLSQYIDFTNAAAAIGEVGTNPIVQMARAVSEFIGVDLDEMLRANVGDLYGEIGELDGSLRTLFGWISKMCLEFKPALMQPESASFTYKGETFLIPVIVQGALAGVPILPNVSVVEAVEAFETHRLSQRSIEETGDETGSFLFSYYLRMLAVIARKPGEYLPADEMERERFLSERQTFFRDIDAATALNVDFFLFNTLPPLGMTNHVFGSLMLQNLKVAAGTLKQKLQHGKRR